MADSTFHPLLHSYFLLVVPLFCLVFNSLLFLYPTFSSSSDEH